jgi:hypothetical protein
MEPHVEKVFREKQQLEAKLAAAAQFVEEKIFLTLPAEHQDLLRRELELMKQYAAVLAERLAIFPQNHTK